MDAISWYALGRVVDDPTTIMEEIDTKVLQHNLDASAHGQSNEAVYNHRITELLDHVAYSIYNIKTNPFARVYKAIVGSGMIADFETIQAAIDWTNLYGGGQILVRAGTYVLSSDVTLYNNIEIIGEDNDTCIFDFNLGAYQFKLIGTSGTHKKNCFLRNIQVKNSRKGYYGAVYFNYCDDSGVENCKFSNNKEVGDVYGGGVCLKYCVRSYVTGSYFSDDQVSINLDTCTKCWVNRNYVDGTDTIGIYVVSGSGISVFDNYVVNSAGGAIWLDTADKCIVTGNHIDTFTNYGITTGETDAANYLLIANNYIEDGGVYSAGIYLSMGSAHCSVVGNVLKNNNGVGIVLYNADQNTITGNVVTGGGTGIEIDSYSDKNICVANNLAGNSTGLTNNGTNGQTANNITS